MAFKPDRALRWDVLELHLDEAAFLWQQWEKALDSPLHAFPDLAEGLERRLDAHLSALAAAGRRAADRLLTPALADKDLDRARAAASALLAPGEGRDIAAVIKAYAHGKQVNRPAIARALQLSASPEVSQQLLPLLEVTVPFTLVPAIWLLAFRRAIPEPDLARLLNNPDPGVASAALAAARFAPGVAGVPMLEHALRSTPAEQEAALVTGLVSGYRSIWRLCGDLAAAPGLAGSAGRTAQVLLAMGGEDEELDRLIAMLDDRALTADALWALGFNGRVRAADACLPWMEQDDRTLARLAGEAFSAITGLELTGRYIEEDLTLEDEEPIPFEQDDLDAKLEPGPESDLPLPEPGLVSAWWSEARPKLDPAGRYLSGRPFDLDPLLDALQFGAARRRHMLALELAIRSRGAIQVETRAFARTQVRELTAARGQRTSSAYTRPFETWMSR
jgi:uncharacterized protein (TIGR02270 family)